MANIDGAFNVDKIAIDDLVLIAAGSIDPAAVGYDAPVGSMYLSTSGVVYRKTGPLDTEWSLIASGGVSNHEGLLGLQGGTTGEYFHLTDAEHASILAHMSADNNPHLTSLVKLSDTVIQTPTNNQFVMYNLPTNKWVNRTPTTADMLESTNRRFVNDADIIKLNNISNINSGDQTDATLPFSDITTNNASVTKHGFLPKLSGDAHSFLNGLTGAWLHAVSTVFVKTANGISGTVTNPHTTPEITLVLGNITPTTVNGIGLSGTASPTLVVTGSSTISGVNNGDQTDATLPMTDITTNNASTSKHGFLRKLSGNATAYLDGSGNWSTPAAFSAGARSTYAYTGGAPFTTVPNEPFVVPFGTSIRSDANITYNSTNKTFTFAVGDWYSIFFDYGVIQTGATGANVIWEILLNGVSVANSLSSGRSNLSGMTGNINTQVNIPNGGVISARLTSTTGSVTTNSTKVIDNSGRIMFIKG